MTKFITPGDSTAPTSSSILFTATDNNPTSANYLHTFYYDLALGDVGLNSRSFVNGTQGANGTLSWDLSKISQFANYAADTAYLKWSVVGGEAKGTDNLNQWGALSTGVATTDFVKSSLNINKALNPVGSIGSWIGAFDININTGDVIGNNVGDKVKIDASTSFQDLYFPHLGDLGAPGTNGPFLIGSGTDNFYWITNPTGSGPSTANLLGTFSLASNDVLTFQSANGGNVVNKAPSLTKFTTNFSGGEDKQISVTLANLIANSDAKDVDGTVVGFDIKTLSTGSLKIGFDALKATAYNATTNHIIDATHNAYWTPALNANGLLDAFTIIAQDDKGEFSATAALQTKVSVTAVNDAPTLSLFAKDVATAVQSTPVQVTLANLKAQGNEADVDGTVTAFDVKSVTTGTLKIGLNAATATAYNATTNHIVDAQHNAFWTPAANAYGLSLKAFNVVAKDNAGLSSATAVQAKISVNHLITGTSKAETLNGLAGNDNIYGLAGNDLIVGGAGNDVLTGGVGNDIFFYNTAPNAANNKDTITDFVSVNDDLQFSKAAMGAALGTLGKFVAADQRFWSGTTGIAHDATDRLIYNSKTGLLSYDIDGTGATKPVAIELLGTATHPDLLATDIILVA